MLAPIYSGLLVPAYTGRETWVGAGSWTPDFDAPRQRGRAALLRRGWTAPRRSGWCALGRALPALGLPRPRGRRAAAGARDRAAAPLRLRDGVARCGVERRRGRRPRRAAGRPAVLAFFSGGFFDEARLWAALAACALLALAALVARRCRAPAARGCARGRARRAGRLDVRCRPAGRRSPGRRSPTPQRVALYAGAVRRPGCCSARRAAAVEPALALGALVVIGYGARRPAAARRGRPGGQPQRARPARAAADLLERDRRAGGARAARCALRLAGDPVARARLRAGGVGGRRPARPGRHAVASRAARCGAGGRRSPSCSRWRRHGRAAACGRRARRGLARGSASRSRSTASGRSAAGAREGEGAACSRCWSADGAPRRCARAACAGRGRAERRACRLRSPSRRLRARGGGVAWRASGAAAVAEDAGRRGDGGAAASADSNRYGYWRVALRSLARASAAPASGRAASASSGGASAPWPIRRPTRTRSRRDARPSSDSSACAPGGVGRRVVAAAWSRRRRHARRARRGPGRGARAWARARGAGLGLGDAGADARRRSLLARRARAQAAAPAG